MKLSKSEAAARNRAIRRGIGDHVRFTARMWARDVSARRAARLLALATTILLSRGCRAGGGAAGGLGPVLRLLCAKRCKQCTLMIPVPACKERWQPLGLASYLDRVYCSPACCREARGDAMRRELNPRQTQERRR